MLTIISAYSFTLVASLLFLFHLALALGAPLGYLTQGGFSKGKLPKAKRFAAIVQMALLVLMILIVLTKAGLVESIFISYASTLIWLVVAISLLSFILNVITPSKSERLMGVPITLVLLLSSGYLAIN